MDNNKEYMTYLGEIVSLAALRAAYDVTKPAETFAEYVSNAERLGKITAVYYTTYERDERGPLAVNHDTEAEARAYAEDRGLTYYERIGLTVDDFDRCAVCGRWVPSVAVDSKGICDDCNS